MDALEEMIQRTKQTDTQMRSTEHLVNDVCPICGGYGRIIVEDGGQGTVVECECGIWQKQISESRLRFANIPETFKEIRLNSFDINAYSIADNRNKAEIALKCAKYWMSEFEALKERGMGLYLYSKTKGSGKTRMAVSIANELMHEKGCQVKFCTSLQILNEIKATWDKQSSGGEGKLLDFLSTSEILIIDDFGTEQSDKPWINERFYQIINNRYVDKKITIFTSNERLDLLKYDDRITNRIKERVFQVPFPEESVRDIIAKENMKELVNALKKGASCCA